MNDKNIVLSVAEFPDLRLRTIGKEDIENLRIWKNTNKGSFFLNKDITSAQQEKWFENFRERGDDYMFIVEQKVAEDWKEIGCLGFRKLADEGCVDAYNIIRAIKIEPASFTMSDAFRLMLAFADSLYENLPIRCKVLVNNPAVEWYKKNDFSVVDRVDDEYYLMELSKDSLKNFNLIIKNTR